MCVLRGRAWEREGLLREQSSAEHPVPGLHQVHRSHVAIISAGHPPQ